MPATFLNQWTAAYVRADPRDRGRVEEAASQCLADAERDGFSRVEVKEAASGDLADHFKKAIKRTLM
jgi:hypothetical protein